MTNAITSAAAPASQGTSAKIFDALANFAGVSQIIRITGAGIVVASMSVFLLQGWHVDNDAARYGLLLAQTALLICGGFGLSYLLKENKGARIFFGLGLISVPVNFTVLGALIYSRFQWDLGLVDYPDYARWVASDPSTIVLVAGGAMLALIPATWFVFSIMARRSALPLTALFLTINALLLLPLRSPLYIGIIVSVAALFAGYVLKRMRQDDVTLSTAEGVFSRLAVFIALVIMVVRTFGLYDAGHVMIAMLAASTFMVTRQVSFELPATSKRRIWTEALSPILALVVTIESLLALNGHLPEILYIPLGAAVLSTLVFDVARRSVRWRTAFTTLAAIAIVWGLILNQLLFDSSLNAFATLIVGIAVITYAWANRQRLMLLVGFAGLLVSGYFLAREVLYVVDFASWSALAITGALTIIIGSVLDRHGVTLKLRIQRWLHSNETPPAGQEDDSEFKQAA